MKIFYFLLLIPFIGFTQTQIGQDIDGELTIGGDLFGSAISISSDGSVIAVGAPENDGNGSNSGHVQIYKRISGEWTQIGNDIDGEVAGNESGYSVSLSSDGSIVAIGTPYNDGNGIYSGHVRIYRNISGVWTQIGDDIEGVAAYDYLGSSVSLSSDGSIVAIGATGNDSNGSSAGHVRVFKNISGVWTQIGNDIEGAAGDYLGSSVSLSSDGSILSIGATPFNGNSDNSGRVRLYKNISGVWTQIGNDIEGVAAYDYFGLSVSISSDGNIVAIGAPENDGNGSNSGHVRVYRNISDVWTQIGDDIEGAAGDYLGSSVSISSDGNIVAIGVPENDSNGFNLGHVSVYRNVFDTWIQIGNDINGEARGDLSGSSVSISSDGNIVAIGAPGNDGNGVFSGHVRVYRNVFDTWIQEGTDIDGGEPTGGFSGRSVSLSSDVDVVAIGAIDNNENGYQSGHVRVFENKSGIWAQVGEDIDGEAAGDRSGFSVSLSSYGSIVAIGARFNKGNGLRSGHVRVFENISGVWIQIGNDINGEARGDLSGSSVSISSDGNIVAIGAPGNDGNGPSSGHVRVFKNISGVWTQIGEDIDGEAVGDYSGYSVNLSSDGSIVAIGARYNDGNGSRSGHVRVYKNISGVWTQIGADIDGEGSDDQSGFSISLSSDGSIVAIGATGSDGNGSYSGHVRVFKNISGVWTQIGADIDGEESDDQSGFSISLSSDGSIVAIGAIGNNGSGSRSGHVRVYKNISGVWTQMGDDINGEAAGDGSGISLSLSSDGSIVAIGAIGNKGNGSNSGHVRIYDLSAVLSTESFNQDYFSMYPNPAQSQLELKLKSNQELKQVNIYTILGEYLYSLKTLKLDISHLSSGIYVLEVETNQGRSAKKLIKE